MTFIARIIVTSVALSALAACSHQAPPNCDEPLYNVNTRLQKMANNGQGEAARQDAERYGTCFDKQPRYWLMMSTLLPYFTGDTSHLERDAKQALEYTNKAIALDPHNGQYKMGKVGLLAELHRNKEAMDVYESVLAKVLSRDVVNEEDELERQGVMDAAVPYVQAAKRESSLARAKNALMPFLTHMCATKPDYVDHYSQMILWLNQQFNEKTRSTAKAACSDF